MSDWRTDINPGYRTKTLQHGNCAIIVHRPILTKEEAAKRERQVLDAMGSMMRDYIFKGERNA